MTRDVDPKVLETAYLFVDDLLAEVKAQLPAGRIPVRQALVNRAAAAMQQAIEDEMVAIRRELLS